MPHLTLEYSMNIVEREGLKELFEKLHLVLTEMLPTDLATCRSVPLPYEKYYLGDGDPKNAFVDLELKVLAGRTPKVLKTVAQRIMQLLTEHFAESMKTLKLRITVAIEELPKTYVGIFST